MYNFREIIVITAAMVGTVGFAGAATKGPGPNAEVVAGSWQHHSMKIIYLGRTTLFSCSALEDHVKAILMQLGARKDANILAYGCRGPDQPSRNVSVDADFYTLAPVADGSSAGTVQAYWVNREIQPERPYSLDEGDCELVYDMKDMISNSFALKNLEYDASCVPNQLNLNGYHVKANALIAVPPPKTKEAKRS
jgi:hypothetical protein